MAKIRTDFVTNSSSSSFICCFAKIADKEKAKPILDKYCDKIDRYTGEEVLEEIEQSYYSKWLEYDWANVDCTPDIKDIESNAEYIVITDNFDIYEAYDDEPNYDVDYDDFASDTTNAIDDITKENGFIDIDIQYGAGRNG